VPAAVLQIGGRIRAERAKKGISLRSLARGVGLSPSLISQIETGKCQPSVSTLYAITNVLGISVQDVLGETAAAAEVRHAAGAGRVADGNLALAAAPAAAARAGAAADLAGPVVCPGQRDVLELDLGVVWQRLGQVPGSNVDFLLVTYQPGGCSSPGGRLMRHAGTEYGYLIQGELTLTLGRQSHRLTPGDAVSFPSVTPHAYRNEGTVPSAGVWFVADSGGG